MRRGSSLLLLAIPFTLIAHVQAAELSVQVDGIASDRGTVRIAMYRQEAGYLDGNAAMAVRLGKAAACVPGVTVNFPDIPPGEYAIKVFQDENDDGKLNRNLFGIPTEPYGISNNVRARFSLPPFGKALIDVRHPRTEIRIHLDGRAAE